MKMLGASPAFVKNSENINFTFLSLSITSESANSKSMPLTSHLLSILQHIYTTIYALDAQRVRYLLNPLRACSHIRPTPRNAIVICLLPASRPSLNSNREPSSLSTDLLHVSFGRPLLLILAGVQRMATLGIDVGGILLTCPIHLHLRFFTSNQMGSIPVRSWSSALVILFGQKMCRILLRHLFWSTSSMWHTPLVTFQVYVGIGYIGPWIYT